MQTNGDQRCTNLHLLDCCLHRYLSDFRTKQCQLFLERKCPHHRPFSCFHWHFDNQRRRPPYAPRSASASSSSSSSFSAPTSKSNANGAGGDAANHNAAAPVFAYSPHLYCPKYETAGTCPDADTYALLVAYQSNATSLRYCLFSAFSTPLFFYCYLQRGLLYCIELSYDTSRHLIDAHIC